MESYDERLIYYATAPRATAAEVSQIIDGNFVCGWAGKLRGKLVKLGDEFRFSTKEEAIDLARRYRQACREEAQAKGLLCTTE